MTHRLHELPDLVTFSGCHIVTIDHEDAVLLEVILKRWRNGFFFDGEEAEEPWLTRGQPLIDKIEAIATWNDLGTIDSKLAEKLGRLMVAIRKEYAANYKTLGQSAKRGGRIIKTADGLFKHDYRWINDLGNKFFRRPTWNHFLATAKEQA